MSAIDKLKNNSGIISFDTTASANTGKTVKAGEAMDIDMIEGSDNVSVEATTESSEMNLGSLRRGNHQVVLPKEKNAAPTATRTVASVVDIGTPEAPDEDIHISPEHDMLNIENPDSMFSKYVAQKDQEAAEWIAEKEEEKRVLEEEAAMAAESDGIVFGDEVTDDYNDSNNDEGVIIAGDVVEDQRMVGSYNMSNIENEDLSGLIGENEAVEETVEEEVVDEFDDNVKVVEEDKNVVAPIHEEVDVDIDVNVVKDESHTIPSTKIENEKSSAISTSVKILWSN